MIETRSSGTRSDAQRIFILVAAILQVVVTLLPSFGIGEAIGDRSDSVRTAITPAGWAFSIWGLLYAGSFAYAVYQLLPAQRDNALLDRMGWASGGAFMGNALWALYVQFNDLNFVSSLIILFTLLCLLNCYRAFAEARLPLSSGERFLVVLPLSLLAAWLTAASIVNITASLTYHDVRIDLLPTPLLAAGVVVVGGVIAAAAVWTGRGNPWYALVFLWALSGIYSANVDRFGEVRTATIIAGLLVAAAALARLANSRNRARWLGGQAG